jgi:hypothetical protein
VIVLGQFFVLHARTPSHRPRCAIMARLTPRPRCAMPPRLVVVDTVRCTPLYLLPPPSSNCSKNDASMRERDTKRAAIVRSWSPRYRVSSGVARVSRQWLQWRCLQQGNDAYTLSSPAITRVRTRFSPAAASPQHIAETRCGIARSTRCRDP